MTKNQQVNGMDLFAERYLTLNDGKKYKVEFTNRSLMQLEFLFDGDMTKVFDIYRGALNATDTAIGLWGVLIAHNEEFRGMGEKVKEIALNIIDLIPEGEILAVKFTIVECFGAFWNKARQSKQLAPQYQELLNQYEEEEAKKK